MCNFISFICDYKKKTEKERETNKHIIVVKESLRALKTEVEARKNGEELVSVIFRPARLLGDTAHANAELELPVGRVQQQLNIK